MNGSAPGPSRAPALLAACCALGSGAGARGAELAQVAVLCVLCLTVLCGLVFLGCELLLRSGSLAGQERGPAGELEAGLGT